MLCRVDELVLWILILQSDDHDTIDKMSRAFPSEK
jgi:hypothetical protein